MRWYRNRLEIVATACFIVACVVMATVSVAIGLPFFFAGVALSVRSRAHRAR